MCGCTGEDNQEGVSVATQDPTLKEHLLKVRSLARPPHAQPVAHASRERRRGALRGEKGANGPVCSSSLPHNRQAVG
jgi:hypothetical protein